MTNRRSDHEGSVRQRGASWQGRIQLGGRNYYVTGGSKREALERIQTIAAKFYEGTLEQPGPTVADWLMEWQERGRHDWKATTTEVYSDMVRLHLVPEIGDTKLIALTPTDVAACMRACRGVSEGTRLKVYRILHRALNVAMYDGLIPSNPCAAVEAPRIRRVAPRLWDDKELAAFVASWPPSGPEPLLWALLLGAGCRLGEALAMTWGHYRDGSVTVAGTLSQTRRASVVTAPKTDAALRVVQLPASMAAILNKQIGASSAPIVVSRSGLSPNRRLVGRWFKKACADAEVPPMKVHWLRHLHASVLISHGVPITEVAHRLGHASAAITTSVYAHQLRGRGQASVAAIEAALT